MVDNSQSFGISGTEVVTKKIPYDDANVSPEDTFYIERTGIYFFIQPYGSSQVINVTNTSTANLTTIEKTSASTKAWWEIYRYTDVHRWGYSLSVPPTTVAGDVHTLHLSTWSTKLNYNTPNMTVADGYSDIVIGVWNANESTFKMTLLDDGTFDTNIKIGTPTFSGYNVFTKAYTITLPFAEGTYFLKNKQHDNYMQICGGLDASSTEGATFDIQALDGGTYQKWNVTHILNGYYKIISDSSSKAVTAPSALDGNVTQTAYTGANSQMWQIVEIDGVINIISRTIPTGYISVEDGTSNTGLSLKLRNSQTDNKDEWEPFKNGNEVALLSIMNVEEDGRTHDHFSCFPTAMEYFNDTENDEFNLIHTDYISKADCISALQNSKVFISRSHGSVFSSIVKIQLYKEGQTSSWLRNADIYSFPKAETIVDLSGVELVVFAGCQTAYGGKTGDNLVTATVSAGAACAIGFEESIKCGAANVWTKYFCENYASGMSAYQAAHNAKDQTITYYEQELKYSEALIQELGIDSLCVVDQSMLMEAGE